MASLTGVDIKRGDIFLCKSFAILPNSTHAVIRGGQFWLGDAPHRSNNVHAQIALTTGREPLEIAESDGTGIHKGECEVEAHVYRLRDPQKRPLADKAGDVAEELIQRTASNALGRYNYYRSALSVLLSSSFGDSARRLIAEVGSDDYEDGFFCSMLATICYQVAAMKLRIAGVPIEANAMNMSPARLESYLRMHSNIWMCKGIYNRPKGEFINRWKQRVFVREDSH